MSAHKQYLGDAVYADFDGFGIILTTENGICASNTIYLEPEIVAALNRYVEWLKTQSHEQTKQA